MSTVKCFVEKSGAPKKVVRVNKHCRIVKRWVNVVLKVTIALLVIRIKYSVWVALAARASIIAIITASGTISTFSRRAVTKRANVRTLGAYASCVTNIIVSEGVKEGGSRARSAIILARACAA